jgi:2-polyprenyl-3-methyl-5-hydroxy-6-metoxy-1,4-benzoquinol methylase
VVLFCAEVERVSESDTAEQPKYWVDVEGSENHRAQLDLIPPGSRVLEIGAGPGHMTRALARRDCIVTAVEINEALAASARRACERVIVVDVESQDFEGQLGEERFDIVLLGDVLEHLKAPEEFLGRLRCRLTPGGCLVVCLPNVAHGALRLSLLEGRFEYRAEGLLDRTHLRLFTLSSLHETFGAAGYTVSDLRRIRRGLFETEIALDPASIPADALSFVCRDPEAATYQFVFRASPEGLARPVHTDTAAFVREPADGHHFTTAILNDYERWGRQGLFGEPRDLCKARQLFYRAFRLAPSAWRLTRLCVLFLPAPIIDLLSHLHDLVRRRRVDRSST